MLRSRVPDERVRVLNRAGVRGDADYVLYWMVAARRTTFNFGLERAAEWARRLGRPLVVLEALRVDYPYASERFHRFVADGMAETRRRLATTPVLYHPYVEPEAGAGRGLLESLAARAAVVVSDDYPAFFLPRMLAAAASRLAVRLEVVDGNGLLPIAAGGHDHATAHGFRRTLQRSLRDHLSRMPLADPLAEALPSPPTLADGVLARWPASDPDRLASSPQRLAQLPIDHEATPVELRGGTSAAESRLAAFLDHRLAAYGERRNRPEETTTSGLSPYLHFGHISAHQVVLELLTRERWSEEDLSSDTRGSRSGWWGVSASAEAFLDQLVTWRELGFNVCRFRPDHDRFSSLPEWARRTLADHADDPREHLYDRAELEAAATHDPLWNAAQNQLRRDGTIHNYLRMLWGKKILEWSASPEEALETMLALNDRWALDGRDPNSLTGIFWTLGRHDRPWAPERPVFGTVRYMSSANTARKMPVAGYLERYA